MATELERVLKIVSKLKKSPFRTVDITHANKGRPFANTSVVVRVAVERGLLRPAKTPKGVKGQHFTVTAKGKKSVPK